MLKREAWDEKIADGVAKKKFDLRVPKLIVKVKNGDAFFEVTLFRRHLLFPFPSSFPCSLHF